MLDYLPRLGVRVVTKESGKTLALETLLCLTWFYDALPWA